LGGGPNGGAQQQQQQGNQAADFFLSYYRLGKTLGIGSFGKVCATDWVPTYGQTLLAYSNSTCVQHDKDKRYKLLQCKETCSMLGPSILMPLMCVILAGQGGRACTVRA